MGLLIRIVLLLVFIYFIFRVLKTVIGSVRIAARTSATFARAEECPSCHARIRVAGRDMVCPNCGTKLGRSADGKLLIRIN